MLAPARYVGTLARLPAVPSLTAIYNGTSTTTTNEDTSTWTGIDIGTPHPRRLVILATYKGVAAEGFSTVNGIDAHRRVQTNTHEFMVSLHPVQTGTTATITVTAASSIRKAVSVYVFYPEYPIELDALTATATTTTDAVASNMKVQAGGTLIYAGGQHSTLGTFTTTWGGTDAVTEDVDAQLEAAASYTMGHIDVTVSSDTSALTLAESASGTKRLAVVTLGPPRR